MKRWEWNKFQGACSILLTQKVCKCLGTTGTNLERLPGAKPARIWAAKPRGIGTDGERVAYVSPSPRRLKKKKKNH